MTIKHSKIGASSASRWMNCPGSVRLCENTARRSSEYADEGTAAHALAEMCLNKSFEINDGNIRAQDAHNYLGQIVEGQPVTVDMADAVNVYLNEVYSDYKPGDEQEFEVRFSLNNLHTGLFGTADRVRYRPSTKTLRITDYKHGAGVPVEVEDNPQLLYYGLGGAFRMHNRGISKIEIQIVQPRCPHSDGAIRMVSYDAIDVMDFAADLKEAALRTEDPNAPLKPGKWCRWCAAAGFCPALTKQAIDTATTEFGAGIEYDPGELSEALAKVPMIKQWIKSIDEFAYGEAQAGRILPGWKIVEKRGTRKWRDDQQAIVGLKQAGLSEAQIYEKPELLSVPKIEKVVGKKHMKELEELIVVESSGTVLAPLSDRRPAVAKATAMEEFAAIDE